MIPHFENFFPNFFHTKIMAPRNSSSKTSSKTSVVEVQPEPQPEPQSEVVDPIFESPIFKAFNEETQEMIKQANAESFDLVTVKKIVAEITEWDKIEELKFTEEEAWELIEYLIVGSQNIQHMPIGKFIEIHTKSENLKEDINKLYNQVIKRMTLLEYIEKLVPRFVQVRENSEFHKTEDKFYMKVSKSPTLFIRNYLICVFKVIEKEEYYIFVPMKWFMRDKSQYIPFSVTAYNFSIFGNKKYTVIDELSTFTIEGHQYYFGIMDYYKSKKGELAVKVSGILNASAQKYFRDIASKITDEDKFKELLGTPLDDTKAWKQSKQETDDLFPKETLELCQK